MDNPAFVERKKRKQPTYGIDRVLRLWVPDRSDIVVPRGFLDDLKRILQEQQVDFREVAFTDQVEGQAVNFGPWNTAYEPRPDQVPAIDAAVANDGIIIAPAGAGKTLIGCRYIHDVARPTLWLTHTKDLLQQAKANAEKYLLGVGDVGILGDGQTHWGDRKFIVATVQTLRDNDKLIDALNGFIGNVVIDEAHHFPAPDFIEVAGKLKAKRMIGLTATPDRKDHLQAYMYYGVGRKRYEIERDGLYEAGHLVKPEVRFVYTAFNFEQASDRNEWNAVDAGGEDLDYRALLDALIADDARAKLVAENIVENCYKNYSLVLTESIRYCYKLRDLVERFARARWGVVPRIEVVHGSLQQNKWIGAKTKTNAERLYRDGHVADVREHKKYGWQVLVQNYTDEEYRAWQITDTQRRDIIARASARQVDILFATQLAREGLDMPHLTVGHMAMPKRGDTSSSTKNGAAVEQEIGRIMRRDPLNPDKKALWFDYVDYSVGVFESQYQTRRSVYRRLGITLPKKPRTQKEEAIDFLLNMGW